MKIKSVAKGLLLILSAGVYSTPALAFNLSDLVNGISNSGSKDKTEKEADDSKFGVGDLLGKSESPKTIPVEMDASTRIVIGFSPEGSAQNAILGALNSAKSSIRMEAYSFTSTDIVKALISAKRRGVDVRIVVDEKENKGKYSVAALNLVANAKIPVRTISKYKIHHDKTIIIDDRTVETGSFNYSKSADQSNSENAIVLYNFPEVAAVYLKHWESRWGDGIDWKSTY